MNDLPRLSATQLHGLIRARTVSCREVMAAVLAQAAEEQSRLNAFALLDEEGAMHAADQADEALMHGQNIGPLHGIPFTVKDLLDVEGLETGFGSWLMQRNVARSDAEAVRRLRAAGAIPIGKTTTPEFAGSVLTESPRYGVTRNPWDEALTPGGSSGGAGAAVASGCGPLGLATDGAGSARIPASCCGVLGLKPTLGRVPHPQGPDLFSTFTHIGLLTRTLPDLALALNVLTGPHPADPWSIGRAWEVIDERPGFEDAGTERLAWYFPLMGNPWLSTEVGALCGGALVHLREAGLDVRQHDEPLDWGIESSRTIMRSLTCARMSAFDEPAREKMSAGLRRAIDEGKAIDAPVIQSAPLERTRLYRMVETLLAERPLLLSPTLSAPPPLADMDPTGELAIDGQAAGDLRSAWFTYPTPFNLTGHPALSIPIGLTASGLPVGLQAVAGWGEEQRLFDLAHVLMHHFDWPEAWPPGFTRTE